MKRIEVTRQTLGTCDTVNVKAVRGEGEVEHETVYVGKTGTELTIFVPSGTSTLALEMMRDAINKILGE